MKERNFGGKQDTKAYARVKKKVSAKRNDDEKRLL